MGALLGLGSTFDWISRGVGKFASFLILPLIFLIMFDVITRKIDFIKDHSAEITMTYGFSVSFILQDLQWHVHGALLLMTFGFGYLLNSHVRVDIFRENVSRRKQVWVETFGLIICAIPFLLLMIWFKRAVQILKMLYSLNLILSSGPINFMDAHPILMQQKYWKMKNLSLFQKKDIELFYK